MQRSYLFSSCRSHLCQSLRRVLTFAALFSIGMHSAVASTKVAFIADQDVKSPAQSVLDLIAQENVDLVMIQGDLGYRANTATLWESMLSDTLGKNFPVLTVAGNHENFEWPLYQRFIEQRVKAADGLSCQGDIGVKAKCQFKNLTIVQAASALDEVPWINANDNYAGYIRSSFKDDSNSWRICSWHKNRSPVQVSRKGDSVSWDLFDACLDAGAMVVMGHSHTYSRTHTLSNYRKQTVATTSNNMLLEPGKSFAIVSGLGGRDIKSQIRSGDHFATVYTKTQGANHGALFCDFNSRTASCYFKAVDGGIPDRFTITNKHNLTNSDSAPPDPQATSKPASVPQNDGRSNTVQAGVFSRTDKNEYRWIDRLSDGSLGNVWITRACAQRLGGARYSGNWRDLIKLAPTQDSIPNPCNSPSGVSANATAPADSGSGYVFSRTDKDEYRWIDSTPSGDLGNIWINKDCAKKFGGASVTGNWSDLNRLAPLFDSIASPCNQSASSKPTSTASAPSAKSGYVFKRSDKSEYRWIAVNSSGQTGSVWIDETCAKSLGDVKKRGTWFELMRIAPGFDTLEYPC